MRNPSLAEVILAALDSRLEGVHIALPGTVVKYYPEKQTADIECGVKLPLRAGETGGEITHEKLPTFPEVPIAWPSGGGYFVAFGLAEGDPVQLLFNDVAIGDYLSTGKLAEPTDSRRHSLGYPIAIPGGARPDVSPLKDPPSTGVVIGKDDAEPQIHLTDTDIKLGKTATDFVALSSLVLAELNALRTYIENHTHPDIAAGGGPVLAPLVGPAAINPVAATLTKAK